MRYVTIAPQARLRDFIRCFWVLEGVSAYTHHAMADTCPELVFHYDGRFDEIRPDGRREQSFAAGINGPSRRTRSYRVAHAFGIFGVYFYPHAIPLVFDVPTSDIADEEVALGTWPGGPELEERVITARDHAERIALISDFVAQRLSRHSDLCRPVFRAITSIIHGQASASVKQAATDHFLSERQFERQFLRFAGLNPKLFSRIARFHEAMAFYGDRAVKLTEIALHCGYYDQSHFIHDFRQFSGLHPKRYFSGLTDATLWRD